jgi:hypothetical protein
MHALIPQIEAIAANGRDARQRSANRRSGAGKPGDGSRVGAQAGSATDAITTLANPSQQAVQNAASCTLRSVRTICSAVRRVFFMPASLGGAQDGAVTARRAAADP